MSSNRILSHSFHCYDLFLLLPECKVPDFLIAFYENTFHSGRSEEHTSELQSQSNLVCRLLLEKKKQLLAPTPPAGKPLIPKPCSPTPQDCRLAPPPTHLHSCPPRSLSNPHLSPCAYA